MGKYDDIINLPHRISPTRKKMSNHDRAAQFAPYAALAGYGDAINEAASDPHHVAVCNVCGREYETGIFGRECPYCHPRGRV